MFKPGSALPSTGTGVAVAQADARIAAVGEGRATPSISLAQQHGVCYFPVPFGEPTRNVLK